MIRYKVKARLARNLGTDEFELEEFEEVFIDQENPINARKQAYRYYENILDILGADAYKESTIWTSLNTPLGNYLKKRSELPLELQIKLPESYPKDLGVGLYFFSDNEDLLSKQEDYFLMGYYDFSSDAEKNLELEKRLYDLNDWDTQDWITTIKYYDFRNAGGLSEYDEDPTAIIFSEVLWCPTDFWTDNNPKAFAENDNIGEEVEEEVVERQVEFKKSEESILSKIIKQGENRNLEFKSTFRYCLEKKCAQHYIEFEIIKTIAAFANTNGGTLIIGVDDEGKVLGLEDDFNIYKASPKDKFLKHFANIIKSGFTQPIDAIIKYDFDKSAKGEVFFIIIEKSKKPRFVNSKREGKQFYTRSSATSQKMDIEDAVNYIIDNWYARD